MSSWISEALWKHSIATASLRTSAGTSGRSLRPSACSEIHRAVARNGRQRLPERAIHSRAMASVRASTLRTGPMMSSSDSGANQERTSPFSASRSRR